MFAGKKSAQIREILISESAWEEMTCLFAPSLGLFNIMDFALYSFPIFFFCIMGYRQDKRVKDAFKGLIPGLIVSLILTTFVLFVKDQSDCTNKYDSGSLSAAVCERLEGPGFR